MNVLLTFARCASLVAWNDQSWFARTPYVQRPDSLSITIVGPADHWPLPIVGSLVIGRLNTGPTPQIQPDFVSRGEKNAEKTMSLRPYDDDEPGVSAGWLTNGMIQRPIRFHLSLSVNGTTGCTFKIVRVPSW